MRRKCYKCLCRTCLKTCRCQNCKEKVNECSNYNGFGQITIFETSKPKIQSAPRYSWDHYGISKEQYKNLTISILSGKYDHLARSAAFDANKDIAEYILISVKKNKSYENVEYVEGLGRIPCGRTDFYGYRRLFYYLFSKALEDNTN